MAWPRKNSYRFPAPMGRSPFGRNYLYRKIGAGIGTLIVASIVAYVNSHDRPEPRPQASMRVEGSLAGTIVDVLDGDTILIRTERGRERIRLLGIDTPEALHDEKALYDAQRTGQSIESINVLGRLASKHTKSLVPKGSKVRVVFDKQKRDQYNRLLGYVFLADNSLLNELIIGNGFASLRSMRPNIKYRDQLAKAYYAAKNQKRGLWKQRDHRVLEIASD